MIWIKSKNCETWLTHRTNYSRSLAVMSIVGYILGLGDRHPSNLMMSKKTGKIIHIDFGDCFEVAMKREKFPEKVPFRLTRMLVKALEVSGIEGTFRIISEKVMELLRNNKDSLLAILGSFLYDPLISFRLMIPMIMKMKKQKNKNNYLDNDDNLFLTDDFDFNKKISKSLNLPKINLDIFKKFNNNNKKINNIKDIKKSINLQNNKNLDNNKDKKRNIKDDNIISKKFNDNNKKYIGRRDTNLNKEIIKDMDKIFGINEEKEKDEKKKLENDERQIFILY